MIATKSFVFRFSDIELREDEFRATRAGEPLDIEPKAFRVLIYLVRHAGHLVFKTELIDAVWGETAVTENSLTRAIALLRRVLEDDPRQPRFIETVSTAGYRFVCPVEIEASAESSADHRDPPAAMVDASPVRNENGIGLVPRWRWALAATMLFASGIMAVAWWAWWSGPYVPHVMSIDVITDDGRPFDSLVTDQSRVYYNAAAKNRIVLDQVSSAGGETSTIQTPLNAPVVLDIAPDRSSLLLSELGASSLWIFPLPQGPPRRVGDLTADGATYTPDGKKIIFTKEAEVWICDVDGSHARRLWTSPGAPSGVGALRVSPDGKRMRLNACEPSGCFLWEVGTDGSGAHRVLPRWQDRTRQDPGAWSPDGRYYVFGALTQKGAFHANLWLLPERRGWFSRSAPSPVPLTQGPLCFSPRVAFSPDGNTLFAFGMKDSSDVVRYDPTTKKLEPFLPGIPATLIDFSRDGQWVVYVTDPYPNLWRSRRDGSERVQLASGDDLSAGIARWSPDGSRIAFTAAPSGGGLRGITKLSLISRDGGKVEQLIADKEDSHAQNDPTWSPDGKEIIFAADPVPGSAQPRELLRVDVGTRKVTLVPGSEGLFSPRWSPDGRYLAAFTTDIHTIRRFDFQKQLWTTWFTAQEGTVGWNHWSPDSRTLDFIRDEGNGTALAWWRIAVGEKTPTKIMELPEQSGVLGGWYAMGPDGKAYFTRDLSSYEIYALHLSEK